MKNSIDMTKGSPLSLLIRFALPLMLTYILQQLYSLCDSVIVDRFLGLEAFASIGAAALVAWLPQSMFLGLAQGYGAVFAQLFGAGDAREFRKAKNLAAWLSASEAIAVALILIAFRNPLLNLIQTPQELRGLTSDYLLIIYAGLPIDAMFNWSASVLRATGDSRTPLIALFIASAINIVLDFLLIYVFPLGVQGAALATVIAQLISFMVCFTVMSVRRFEYPPLTQTDVDGSLKRLLYMGLPPMLRDGVISIGGLFVQSVINKFGFAFVAGMAAAGRYFSIMSMSGGAIEGAIGTFSGQNTGAGLSDRVRQGTKIAALLSLGLSMLTMIITVIIAPYLIRLITGSSDMEALRMGVYALRCTAFFLPALYMLCLYRAALQGMGESLTPMLSGFVELAMRVFCVICLPTFLGYTAACIADGIGWVAASLLLVSRYFAFSRRKQICTQHES